MRVRRSSQYPTALRNSYTDILKAGIIPKIKRELAHPTMRCARYDKPNHFSKLSFITERPLLSVVLPSFVNGTFYTLILEMILSRGIHHIFDPARSEAC